MKFSLFTVEKHPGEKNTFFAQPKKKTGNRITLATRRTTATSRSWLLQVRRATEPSPFLFF